jgi:integrase
VDEALVGDFVASVNRLTPRGRDNIFCVVWQAIEHARRHEGPVSGIPCRPSVPRSAPRRPYVLTDAEIDQLLRVASQRAHAAHPLCPATYAGLFGLLLTTGLRVGEAVALDVQDLDVRNEVLMVRLGKFRKARLVPIASSTVAGLQSYLRRRRRHGHPPTGDGPLFVTATGRRFSIGKAWNAFRRLVDRAGLRDRAGRRPRVHDLRHTFAVRRVIAWHREGRDVNQLLSPLSTYLGHVGIKSTQVYLQPTAELLAVAGKRFEAACAAAVHAVKAEGA